MPKHELIEVFSQEPEIKDLGSITAVDFSVSIIVDTDGEKPRAVCRVSLSPAEKQIFQTAFTFMDRIKNSLVNRLSRQFGERVSVGVNESKFGHHALGFFAEGPIEEFVDYFARREQNLPEGKLDVASITFSNDPNAHAI